MRRPYYKQSHGAWYVKDENGKDVRLGISEQEAMAAWAARCKDTGFTLSQLVAKWLAWVKANRSKDTLASYKRYADNWCVSHGKLGAAAIRGHHVTEWVDRSYPPMDYSDSVRWQAQKVAVVMFSWAKSQGLLDVNPLADYRKNARCGKRDTFLTLDQHKKLLAACEDSDFKELLECLWETGARPFEMFQATAKHLDRKARCLRFKKAGGDKVKSHDNRTIWLSDRAYKIIARRADQFPEGVLFRNNLQQKWTVTACSRRFSALFKATGIKTSLYEYRHGWCHHHATVKKTDILTLAALGGWSSVKMLTEVYAHAGQNVACMQAAVNGHRS